MYIVCCDLEGVLVPEVWINVARWTGIDELKLTTRDIADYNALMTRRLEILRQHGITINDIQKVISLLELMPGALDFINWLHKRAQFLVVSDTFREFADPLLEKMGWPFLFCHHLTIDKEGYISDFHLRQPEAKMHVVKALQSLNYRVIAIGDSYNDITMLRQAEVGVLFNPPENVVNDNSDLMVANSYLSLKKVVSDYLEEN